MIGQKILHYQIIEKLGEGGMGVVYLAEDSKLERKVAIKFLPHHISDNSDERKRFEIEAKAAAALNHPNIATIHAIEYDKDDIFMVMEYIDGCELKEIVGAHPDVPLPIDDVVNYAIQIAEGLQAAHKKGIVHRDIKSANIMVTEDGKVKIMDFGLAKIRGGIQITKEQSTLGTAAYMSPEQAKGDEVDHRSDIWSFGVVFYEMLTGELPFDGDYEQAVIYSIINEDSQPITGLRTDIPIGLEQIVDKALKKNLNERFQNADELLTDLKIIADLHRGISSKTSVLQNKELNKKSPYFYVGISAIIVLITLMSILFFPKMEQENSIESIAVLPFSNIKNNPETDYFGFAIANQIIGDLDYLKNITVRPSGSIRKYEKQVIDPIIAGDELNVNYVLIGNYLKEGNIIRLNVELIKVSTNDAIWREDIDVDYHNAFELQDIVAKKVVEGLNVQFSQKELNRIRKDVPDNSLAYEYYLRSISYPLSKEGDQLAIEMLNKSIELDSNFAPAYVELGERIHELALYGKFDSVKYNKSEELYQKAISLNKELISALANLAQIYTETARSDKAVEIARQILVINPNNASAHFSLGYIYRYAGMNIESIEEMEKAIFIDPENPRFRSLSLSYYNIGEYEKALNVFEIVVTSDWVTGMKGFLLFKQGKNEQALEIFNQIIDKEPDGFWGLNSTIHKAIIQGDTKKGLLALQKREQMKITDAEPWYYTAVDYALLGDKDGCIRALQRAVDGGYFNYPLMLMDSDLDSVRDDPEFKEILKKAKEKHLAFKKKFFPGKS